MNDLAGGASHNSGGFRFFRAIKYLTYALLSVNIFLFLQEELGSASHSLADDPGLATLVQLFSATLDTAAWVLLLFLFELETAVIPDHRLVGLTKWTIHGLRLVCGAAIVSAFFGYLGEWQVFWSASSLPNQACALVAEDWSVLVKLDEFLPLTPENCASFGADSLSVVELERVLATPEAFTAALHLALVDVINSGAWILVVVLLEIEVRLQLAGGVPRRAVLPMNALKVLLYGTLAVAAVYWGFEGDFLDFWDAALWLFAFVFIELNVFEWQQEIQEGTVE